jgi:hypothetical protein
MQSGMSPFDGAGSRDPIRDDLAAAHRRAWERLARPGTWLDAAERIAVAAEVRAALGCALCRARRAALSPYAASGAHDSASNLSPALIDAVHRVTTDAGRITRQLVRELAAAGIEDVVYVEAIGVVTQVLSIDAFHHALGLPLEPLPEPLPGAPSRRRPTGAGDEGAFVPMVKPGRLDAEDRDLYGGRVTGNVIRALSLVPAEVRALRDLGAAQYLDETEMRKLGSSRALDRAQIELVAGRLSALRECFY